MNVVPLTRPSTVEQRPTAVLVVDDEATRAELVEHIARAGIAVTSSDPEVESDAAMLVLVLDRAVAERLDAIAHASADRPDMAIVAAMPSDATGPQLRGALRVGAAGIVLEGELHRSLAPTVQAVHAGQLAIPPRLRRHMARQPLSHREREVLGLVVRGYTNRQIAGELFLAESTVKTHLSSAFGKLDTRSRAEAAALILDPEEGYGLGILPRDGAAIGSPAAEAR